MLFIKYLRHAKHINLFGFHSRHHKLPILTHNHLVKKRFHSFSDSICLFSAAEHEMFRARYCDRTVSFMRRPSCVVNFLDCVCSRGHISNDDQVKNLVSKSGLRKTLYTR